MPPRTQATWGQLRGRGGAAGKFPGRNNLPPKKKLAFLQVDLAPKETTTQNEFLKRSMELGGFKYQWQESRASLRPSLGGPAAQDTG